MEQNKQPFRLRLNLFDGIILALALLVAAAAIYFPLSSQEVAVVASPTTKEVTFTARITNATPEAAAAFQAGDVLEDAVKNLELGTVVSSTSFPTTTMVLDQENVIYVENESPDYVNIDVVITGYATVSEDEITLASGYAITAADAIYIRGPGYLGSGMIIDIDRGVLE